MFVAIVPAYNEEKRIGPVIQDLFKHVDRVVVVNDASVDKTAAVAHQYGAIVLSHQINRGQGASLETGHEFARRLGAEYVLHFDGDGQFDVQDITPALNNLQHKKADILLGSRFLDTRSNVPALKRYIIHPMGRLVNTWYTGLPFTDAHNGFRILNKKALNVIRLEQDKMAHASEIPLLIAKYNLQYVEHPVKVTYHSYGQGIGSGFGIIKDLFINTLVGR